MFARDSGLTSVRIAFGNEVPAFRRLSALSADRVGYF